MLKLTVQKWTADQIPDQTGRTIIVTGANNGLGYEDTLALANKGAHVVMACRNKELAEDARNRIVEETGNPKVELIIIDLADLKTVKEFAKEFRSKYNQLDILINNAGVMQVPYSKTEDGFEIQMGINHLGHFALTAHLLDMLQATPDSRIVNVSSNAHKQGDIQFHDINWEERKYSGSGAYADSKLANIYFTYEFNRRNKSNDPIAVVTHPGFAATNLLGHSRFLTMNIPLIAQPAAMGALPTLYAATAPDVEADDYYGPDGFAEIRGYPKEVETSELAKDKAKAQRLWELSEELTGLHYSF